MKPLAAALAAVTVAITGCAADVSLVSAPVTAPTTFSVRPRYPVQTRADRNFVRRALAKRQAKATPKPTTPRRPTIHRHSSRKTCRPTAAEMWIIERESGNSVTNYNPVSTSTGHAFGIGQLTTENRAHYARRLGVEPDTTDYCAQLKMMEMYIRERYGTTAAAVAFWRKHHWY